MDHPIVLRREGRELHVLGTVTGLVSEAEGVKAAFEAASPHGLGLGIAEHEIAGLRHFLSEGPEGFGDGDDDAEEGYSLALSRYGEVTVPPADLLEAVRLASAAGVEIRALDLSDEEYIDAFTKEVSGLQLVRYSLKMRRMERKPPKAGSAREFALKWDADVRRLSGFDRLEKRREARMAEAISTLANGFGASLAIIEIQRLQGVLAELGSKWGFSA